MQQAVQQEVEAEGDEHPAASALRETRPVFFGSAGVFVDTPVYERSALLSGNRISGPAIVTQKDSTTVIHVNHYGDVDEYHNILIKPAAG